MYLGQRTRVGLAPSLGKGAREQRARLTWLLKALGFATSFGSGTGLLVDDAADDAAEIELRRALCA